MEKKLKNQPCYDKDGNELGWFSRSVAVAIFIFRRKGNKLQVLLEKRGKGAADNIGKYCSVCGYVEFDDTLEETCKREAMEETGFDIDMNKLTLIGINSSPKENNQNITVRYEYFADENEDFNLKKAIGGEKDEVETVKWFDVGNFVDDYTLKVDVYKMYEMDFAFNHEHIIIDSLSRHYTLEYKDKKSRQ